MRTWQIGVNFLIRDHLSSIPYFDGDLLCKLFGRDIVPELEEAHGLGADDVDEAFVQVPRLPGGNKE